MGISLVFYSGAAALAVFNAGRATYRFARFGWLPCRVSPVPVWLAVAGAALGHAL